MNLRMRSVLLCCIVLLLCKNIEAQALRTIRGTVYTKDTKGKKELLEGVVVEAPGSGIGTQTDANGRFDISLSDTVRYIVSFYVGYSRDTQLLQKGVNEYPIELRNPHTLKEVVIRDRLKTTEIGMLDPMKVEKIGQAELYKAACCNLSSSFETTPSIDVSFTDAVTGYKQIRLLGLAGAYTLITQENIPMIRGLGSITGLTYTPGSWIEGIQLSKGTGSVVNGFESVAGQINVELKKPFTGEKWFINLYQSSQGNSQLDVVFRRNVSQRLATTFSLDVTSQWLKVDLNNDHFIDQPLGKQVNVLNRWIYNGPKGWMVQAGVKVLYADGIGGDWAYKKDMPPAPGNPWGYQFVTQRVEDWMKIAKSFDREETSIGLQLSNIDHNQDSKYGAREYIGIQNSFYANLIFQTYIGNTKNIIKCGMSEMVDIYNETFEQQIYNRNESVPGVFAEYSATFSDKVNMVAGLRGDYDNYYGGFVTPRLHFRYAPFKRTVVRASIGRAQRTANIFADNIGYMASNRQIDILNPVAGKPYGLNPEVAWNMGVNLTHKFRYRYHEGVFTIDYYYTNFENQVVVDVNYPQILNFYNLNGASYAHSFQAQFDYEIVRKLNLRLAYRYYNVMTTYIEDKLQEKPFIPAHRAFGNIAYETGNKWKFDYTLQWLSSERTPGISPSHNHGTGAGINAYSPAFYQMNAQVTKVFSETFEGYIGGDNLTNYMQHDAIESYTNPYSRDFDASLIWGPMMGVNVYVGIRYKIK